MKAATTRKQFLAPYSTVHEGTLTDLRENQNGNWLLFIDGHKVTFPQSQHYRLTKALFPEGLYEGQHIRAGWEDNLFTIVNLD